MTGMSPMEILFLMFLYSLDCCAMFFILSMPCIMFYLNWFSNDSFQEVISTCTIESVSGDFYGFGYFVYCTHLYHYF